MATGLKPGTVTTCYLQVYVRLLLLFTAVEFHSVAVVIIIIIIIVITHVRKTVAKILSQFRHFAPSALKNWLPLEGFLLNFTFGILTKTRWLHFKFGCSRTQITGTVHEHVISLCNGDTVLCEVRAGTEETVDDLEVTVQCDRLGMWWAEQRRAEQNRLDCWEEEKIYRVDTRAEVLQVWHCLCLT